MAGFRLNDLPTELVSHIIETLRPDETNSGSVLQTNTALRTWCDLRLVNRRISAITTPILFHRVRLATQKAIIDLLHLIIVQPSIIELIHGVQIGNFCSDWGHEGKYVNEVSQWSQTSSSETMHPHFMNLASIKQKLAIIREEAKQLHFDEKFCSHLELYGSWPLTVIMLFHIHCDIRELNIMHDFFQALTRFSSMQNYWNKLDHSIRRTRSQHDAAFLRAANANDASQNEKQMQVLNDDLKEPIDSILLSYPHFTDKPIYILSKLELLKIRHSGFDDMLSTEFIYPFFMLPSLKSIQAERIAYPEMSSVVDSFGEDTGIVIRPPPHTEEPLDWSSPRYEGLSLVQKVELTSTALNEKEANTLLQLPKTLRRLKIIESIIGNNHIHVPKALQKAALNGSLDLESLSLIFKRRCPEPLCSLTKSFTSLKYLQTDLYDLLGEKDESRCSDRLIDSLPPAIEILQFKNRTKASEYPLRPKPKDCWCLAEGLLGLLESVDRTTLPELRLIIVSKQLIELSEYFCNQSITFLDIENASYRKGVRIFWSGRRIFYREPRHRNNGILFHCDLQD